MIYELKAGGVDHRRLVGAKLEKLAEGESGSLILNVMNSHFAWVRAYCSYQRDFI